MLVFNSTFRNGLNLLAGLQHSSFQTPGDASVGCLHWLCVFDLLVCKSAGLCQACHASTMARKELVSACIHFCPCACKLQILVVLACNCRNIHTLGMYGMLS